MMLNAKTLKPFGFYLAEGRDAMAGHALPHRPGHERSAIATDDALARTDAMFHFRKAKHRAEALER